MRARTPEQQQELQERLAKARAVRDENRANQARERELSMLAAQARFAPPGDMPERERAAIAARREAIADYVEARAEALRNAAPEDLEAIAARNAPEAAPYKVAVPEPPEPPARAMPPIEHEGVTPPPRIVEPECPHDLRETPREQNLTKCPDCGVVFNLMHVSRSTGKVAPGCSDPVYGREPEEQRIEMPIETEPEIPDTIETERPAVNAVPDFERFLQAQDAETLEVLSVVELRVIFETETKRAQEERKAEVRKAAAARALRHAKATAGLLPKEAVAAAALRDRLAQKVEWTVNMPEAGNSGMLIDEGIRINGRLMQHGERVRGTLAEYESYRAIEWNAHQNELDFQGRGKMSKLRQTATGFINMRGQTV